MKFPYLGFGVGLRTPHYHHVLESRPRVDWFEVICENFMGVGDRSGGRPLHVLEKVRETYPIAFHGVSLSVGSVDPLDRDYLTRLKALADRFEPVWVSDHLCWTGVDGERLHDLLPLPFSEEAFHHVVGRINHVQEFLGRRILVENVSSYVTYPESEMTEWEFLSEVARRADCAILLDINNIYVSAVNHGFDPAAYLKGVPRDRVAQFHLAGFTDKGTHLIDTHDHPVSEAVWELYQKAVERFGPVSTLVEWDTNIPEFSGLVEEVNRARSLQEQTLGKIDRHVPAPWRDPAAHAGLHS